MSIGEVAAPSAARARLKPVLHAALEHELRQQNFERARYANRYILSAALVELDNTVRSRTVTSTAVVSVVLRNQDHVLVASIRGSASAEDARQNAAVAEDEAVRGAVQSAVARVPKVISATERRR